MMHSYTTDKDKDKCVNLIHQYSHVRKKMMKCSSTTTVVLLDHLAKHCHTSIYSILNTLTNHIYRSLL